MDSLETTKMCVDICMAGVEISFGELLRLKTINNILGSKNGAVLNQNSNLLNYNIEISIKRCILTFSFKNFKYKTIITTKRKKISR